MKRVLVTGSSRGIGKAIALALAKDGFFVTVHCRSQLAQAQAVVEEIQQAGRQADVIQFDVTDRATTAHVLNEHIARTGAYSG